MADASASYTGTNSVGSAISGQAVAHADLSNFGDLKFSGSESMSGQGQASAGAIMRILDSGWLFSSSSLSGQAGIASASVMIVGDWTAELPGRVEYDLHILTRPTASGVGTNLLNQVLDYYPRAGSLPPVQDCRDMVGIVTQTPCTGVFTFEIPFVFGTPFYFDYNFNASAVSATGPSDAGSASFNFANSIYWGGFAGVTVGGSAVAYDFQSDSGFDWRQSHIPSGSVPEPASSTLVCVGLGVLAWKRRRIFEIKAKRI